MSAIASISQRLSRRILRISFLVFLLAIVVVAIFSYIAIREEVKTTATKSVDNVILEVEKSLTEVQTVVEILSGQEKRYAQKEVADLISSVVNGSELITSCALAFEPFKGYNNSFKCMPLVLWLPQADTLEFKQLGDLNYDYRTLDWYQIPRLLGKSVWSEPSYDSEGTGKIVTTYSKPLYDRKGEFIGVLKTDVDLEWLNEIISEMKPYANSYMTVIGRNAAFISHPDKDKILRETIFSIAEAEEIPMLKTIGMRMLSGEENFVKVKNGLNGYYGAYAPFQNGWSALMVCSFKDMFKSLNDIVKYLLVVVVAGLVTLYFASRKTIRRVTAPLTEFTYTAMNISRGFFNAALPEVDSDDEIKHLHDSLMYLQLSINRYIKELKASTASNERYESELNIARQIQLNMVSTDFPESEDFDLHATVSPAKEVGGDLYDFFVKDRWLNIAIGDVSGKGVPAALYMAILRYAYRFIANMGFPLKDVMKTINKNVSEGNNTGMFATMFVARINLDTLEMEYCNGGHNPIVVIRPDGRAEFLKAKSNIAVGLFPEFEYEEEKLRLERGCRLILYTDGITEAEARDFSQYGEERIIGFASSVPSDMKSADVTASLVASVGEFTGDNDQNDDITVLTVKL
ncbi:MAG: SpoIIE family protein phosphatase [Bacteroidales bacterium]|nr:SpoIIE family protein phosphatase [Candidatus Cacconaster caballi]